MSTPVVSILIIALFLSTFTCAQVPPQLRSAPLSSRVSVAPESVFTMFRDAGMHPVNHPLNEGEKAKVLKALSILPPLHLQVLQTHLHSISFMDSMPNNALTSRIDGEDSSGMFNITFRAGILAETISEWAGKKEYTSFDQTADTAIRIIAEAGSLDAIQYVLLQEATHVVDAVLQLTTPPDNSSTIIKPAPFTKGIWQNRSQPVAKYTDSILNRTRLRNQSVPVTSAPAVYEALKKTPFASLYSMAAWSEDIAELVTIFHLTQKMKQPYRIVVRKNKEVLARYEPMRMKQVKKRWKTLGLFYKETTLKS